MCVYVYVYVFVLRVCVACVYVYVYVYVYVCVRVRVCMCVWVCACVRGIRVMRHLDGLAPTIAAVPGTLTCCPVKQVTVPGWAEEGRVSAPVHSPCCSWRPPSLMFT